MLATLKKFDSNTDAENSAKTDESKKTVQKNPEELELEIKRRHIAKFQELLRDKVCSN